MRRRIPRETAQPTSAASGQAAAVDERWAGDMRLTCQCSAVFLGMPFVLDAGAGSLDVARAAVWGTLGVLLFLVLVPPRVTAGSGWLRSCWLGREHVVRTDRLVCVRWAPGAARRLVLRDADGGRVEVDTEALVGNPALWSLVHSGVRASLERGQLYRGQSVVRELSRRIDAKTALAILQASGMCETEQV
ncbi:hypothetical protein [Streptomyces sp. NPDC001401]|uniref:hypothetical protein n=1 Tax=Streptomyces sp. NPDC001401 TaxID=3364570 RepID=UPI003679FAAB